MARLRPAAPIGALALILLVYGHLYGRFELSSRELALPDLAWQLKEGAGLPSLDFVARYFLVVSGLVAAVVPLAVSVFAARGILRATTREAGAGRWSRPLLFGIPLVYAAWTIFESTVWGKNHILTYVPRELLSDFFDSVNVPDVTTLESLLSALVVATLVFLVFAASALLLPSDGEDIALLRHRQTRLQHLLYAGAVLIIVALLHVDALLSWPVSFLGDTDGAAVQRLASGHSMANGLYWSLLLAGVYAPVALALRGEALALAECEKDGGSPKEKAAWLEEHGLSSSLVQQASRLAAVLGPLLAGGPLKALLELL